MSSYPAGGYSPSAWSFQAATPNAVPTTIVKSTHWDSGVIACQGYSAIAVSAELSQAGTISIQRYIDPAGTIAIGAPITQALTANTLGTAAVNDGQPWGSFQVTITNSSGSVDGTLSNFAVLLSHIAST